MVRQVISRIVIPAAAIIESCDIKSCRRSELPIYLKDKEHESNKAKGKDSKVDEDERGYLEEAVGKVRVQLTKVVKEIKRYEVQGKNVLNEGLDNAQWLINFLGDEENQAPKAPAIAIGGLTGFIFALRGGLLKKLIFTTIGAAGMASICYPQEATKYSKIAFNEGKQYTTIAYNFVYGIKKDDPPLELPSFPKLPSSISEAWDMLSNRQPSSVLVKEVSSDELLGMGIVYDQDVQEVNNTTGEPQQSQIKDTNASVIISGIHDEASHKQCHCPIGACLTKHDEDAQQPPVLPYPPPVCPPPEHFVIEAPICPPCPSDVLDNTTEKSQVK